MGRKNFFLANDPEAPLQDNTLNMELSFFGMPLYILGVCPENWDESNGDNIIKL
jgi:hypothetical protein